jgi:hypothetical protein
MVVGVTKGFVVEELLGAVVEELADGSLVVDLPVALFVPPHAASTSPAARTARIRVLDVRRCLLRS